MGVFDLWGHLPFSRARSTAHSPVIPVPPIIAMRCIMRLFINPWESNAFSPVLGVQMCSLTCASGATYLSKVQIRSESSDCFQFSPHRLIILPLPHTHKANTVICLVSERSLCESFLRGNKIFIKL